MNAVGPAVNVLEPAANAVGPVANATSGALAPAASPLSGFGPGAGSLTGPLQAGRASAGAAAAAPGGSSSLPLAGAGNGGMPMSSAPSVFRAASRSGCERRQWRRRRWRQ